MSTDRKTKADLKTARIRKKALASTPIEKEIEHLGSAHFEQLHADAETLRLSQLPSDDPGRDLWDLLSKVEQHHNDKERIERDTGRPEASRVADAVAPTRERDAAAALLAAKVGDAEAIRLIVQDMRTGDTNLDQSLCTQVQGWISEGRRLGAGSDGGAAGGHASAANALKRPDLRTAQRDESVLAILVRLGYDPMALPSHPPGKQWEVKQAVMKELACSEPVAKKSLARLREGGQIVEKKS